VADFTIAEAGKPTPPPATPPNLVVGRPAKGMYCADPAGWINAGYKVFVWGNATPVKAQALDDNGFFITPGITWTVQGTNETGTMTLGTTAIEIANKIYVATPKSAAADKIFTGDTNITYSAGGKNFSGVIRRWNSKCDGCHSVPPPHALANAGSAGVSTCRNVACHADFGAKMMESHGYRVPVNEQTTSAGCYRCHPSPCYGGIHLGKFPNDSIGCVTCHGTMIDAANGQMKVPGQLGFPKCENCHVSVNRQPVPYAVGAEQYKNAVGHGRPRAAKALCITCHNSMHMETKPMNFGDGVNNNCQLCHKNMPTEGNMGPVCGDCHENSLNPHLVIK
jgi:predicted CxxxxCH...CXXCH cytochrome family protein